MPSTINGKVILSGDLPVPRVGAWHLYADVEAESLSGRVSIVFEGVTFSGTVTRTGTNGGRFSATIVGGAGGISSKQLGAKNYAASSGTKISSVVLDILREAGEAISPTSDQSVLSRTLPKWHRIAGTASHALTNVLDKAGAVWRVLRDGTIWVGMATYPEAKVDHVLIDEDWVNGVLTIAAEQADLEPGTTFHGQKIDEVVHHLTPSAFRTEARLSSVGSAFNRMLRGVRRQIDLSRPWPGRVSKQNADGTLQIVPDDDTVKGSGLDRVPYYVGIPGAKVKVNKDQRVLVEFEGGDESRPFVAAWQGGAPNEVAVGATPLPNARQGDMIAVTIMAMPASPTAGVGLLLALPTPPGAPPNPAAIPVTAYGIISSGDPKFKTG